MCVRFVPEGAGGGGGGRARACSSTSKSTSAPGGTLPSSPASPNAYLAVHVILALEPFFISLQMARSTPDGSGDSAEPSFTSSNPSD